MVRGLCRAALLGLSGLPGSLGDAGPADVTCIGKASDQGTYTGASGAVYQILCGIDYAGPDIAATHTPTFAGCIDACDSTAGCIDVSYVGDACYMKSRVSTADERDWVWTAKQITPAPSAGETTKLSCEDNASNGDIYKATNDEFEITCGKDYAGGDLLGLSAASFEECIEACDSNAQCVNVAYIHGACYLKKEQKPAVDSAAVWGAVRKAGATPEAPLSCEGNLSHLVKYTSAKNGLYQIMCGVDFGGNDLTATTTATFEECIAACDENTECVDVSYVAPSCYLKNLAEESTPMAHVWTAKQINSTDIPDLPEVDDGIVTCPKYDNQVYTDDKGNQWMIRCKHDYLHNEIGRVKVDNMNECMAWCADQPNCAGAGYVRESTPEDATNCIGRSRAGPEFPSEIKDGFNSMMLMSPFEVISVVYSTVDITNYAVERWQVGNRLEIDTWSVAESITPAQDRIPGFRKSIFILYRYGTEMRTWVGKERSGIITIRPGPISSAPESSMLVPDWQAAEPWIQIIDICYGASQIRDRNIWDQVYANASVGRTTPIVNEVFPDTWYTIEKSAVIWYRDTRFAEDGPLYTVTGREGDEVKLMDRNGNSKRQLGRVASAPRRLAPGSSRTHHRRGRVDRSRDGRH